MLRLVAALALLAALSTGSTAAAAAAPASPTPRQVERFWTPARRAAARPLEMTVDRRGRADVHLGPRPALAAAGSALTPVATPELPPYAWNGRLFVKREGKEGFCSATAIDSPTRSLVLTAGHCVNTGPRGEEPGRWSSYLMFVPDYDRGIAPFGTFVLAGRPRALPGWTREGNPDYDLGAFMVEPNAEGVALADAVGGGAEVVYDRSRRQRFETFGYPGGSERMRTCASGYAGEDPATVGLPGPGTVGIRCRWAPGASGGGWLIGDGTQIDGISTYLPADERALTYGPYFSRATVGLLLAGF
jgi:hypothetical protein